MHLKDHILFVINSVLILGLISLGAFMGDSHDASVLPREASSGDIRGAAVSTTQTQRVISASIPAATSVTTTTTPSTVRIPRRHVDDDETEGQ